MSKILNHKNFVKNTVNTIKEELSESRPVDSKRLRASKNEFDNHKKKVTSEIERIDNIMKNTWL